MYKVGSVVQIVDRNLRNYQRMGVIIKLERGAYRVETSTGSHLILHPNQIERVY